MRIGQGTSASSSETYFGAGSATDKSPYLNLGQSGDIASGNTKAVSGGVVYDAIPTKTSQLTNDSGYVTTDHTYNFSGVSFTSGNSNTGEHNCNNIASNFVGYYTSNGPASTASSGGAATTNDGSIYAQAYSSVWVTQFAQDYRTGCMFVRGKNNGTWQPWRRNLASTYNDPILISSASAPAPNGASRFYAFLKASTTKASIDTGI